jgi:hypothetical protein
MSPSGQSRHFDRGLATSDLPRTTDIIRASRHVSNVPEAEIIAVVKRPSVDNLVDGRKGGHGNENDSYDRP